MTDFLSTFYSYAGDQSKKIVQFHYPSISPGDHQRTKEPADSGYEISEISDGIRPESCDPFGQRHESDNGAHAVPSPRRWSHWNFSITAAETSMLLGWNMARGQFFVGD